MTDSIKLLGISGSLRERSFNKALLTAMQDMLPAHVTLDIYDIRPLPMYNPDLHTKAPSVVEDFLDSIEGVDGLVIASPEYNHSVSGALKNALDWASRRFDRPQTVLSGKPAGIMSAATGAFGGVRGYQHLHDILFAVNMHVLNRPMILVPHARDKFDDSLHLTDETTREFLRQFTTKLIDWVNQLKQL